LNRIRRTDDTGIDPEKAKEMKIKQVEQQNQKDERRRAVVRKAPHARSMSGAFLEDQSMYDSTSLSAIKKSVKRGDQDLDQTYSDTFPRNYQKVQEYSDDRETVASSVRSPRKHTVIF